ncbi:MAG: hypothetical protein H0U63_06680 [Burkholderiales bacterium]|nr:hypothetical protein [Burkholderiales bacterium]
MRLHKGLPHALEMIVASLLIAASSAYAQDAKQGSKFSGVWQFEAARTTPTPAHTSKLKNALDLHLQGGFSENVKWKLGGRVFYDAAYDNSNFYPPAVERDQRKEARALENYLDISKGDWDFRLGRQHIIWGEVVGLFFADVVSAKDMRESVLPEFDRLRIPQWATRAEYSKNDFHLEAIWIPYMTYDKIGKPGADFYPLPPPGPAGFGYVIRDEVIPARNRSNTSYGVRLSYLTNGWDMSGFFYRSVDASPVFVREIQASPTPAFVYTPEHHKISQAGFTLAKDLGDMVLKAEMVYTKDRQYTVTRLTDDDGLVKQNTLDYIVGLEWPLFQDSRMNVQFFGRSVANHDPDTLFKKNDNGVTLLWSTKVGNWEPQVLLISSLRRSDWLARPRATWNFARNWRAAFGVDIFGGESTGFFGRFDNKDRVYGELRYAF